MAWAASREAWGVSARAAARAGTPASMAAMFSSTPMMPVEHTAKSSGARPVAAAAALAIRWAFSMPLGAQALALPLSKMIPWALWSARCSMVRRTGSAFTTLRVKVPAAAQGTAERIMARSFFSGWGVVKLSLMPQWMPAALKPLGAVTPPEMMFMGKTSCVCGCGPQGGGNICLAGGQTGESAYPTGALFFHATSVGGTVRTGAG